MHGRDFIEKVLAGVLVTVVGGAILVALFGRPPRPAARSEPAPKAEPGRKPNRPLLRGDER